MIKTGSFSKAFLPTVLYCCPLSSFAFAGELRKGTAGIGLSTIGRTIHPYPTQAEAIRKLADAYNKTRLTPMLKRIFAAWMKWQRR